MILNNTPFDTVTAEVRLSKSYEELKKVMEKHVYVSFYVLYDSLIFRHGGDAVRQARETRIFVSFFFFGSVPFTFGQQFDLCRV